MKPECVKPRFNRRSFCKRTLLLGGFAAALLGKKAGKCPRPAPVDPAAADKGYQLTPHVQKYYETARS